LTCTIVSANSKPSEPVWRTIAGNLARLGQEDEVLVDILGPDGQAPTVDVNGDDGLIAALERIPRRSRARVQLIERAAVGHTVLLTSPVAIGYQLSAIGTR
jgi:hypothetical protein